MPMRCAMRTSVEDNKACSPRSICSPLARRASAASARTAAAAKRLISWSSSFADIIHAALIRGDSSRNVPITAGH